MPAPQPNRYLLNRVEAYGVSATGDPYADVLLIHPQGGTYKAKAFSRCFGDLNGLHAYEGAEVSVQLSPTGLQLGPIAEQATPGLEPCAASGHHHGWESEGSVMDSESPFFPPEPIAEESALSQGCSTTRTVQEVATTVANLARDLNLPTVIWLHLPGRQEHHSLSCTVAPRRTTTPHSRHFAP